MRYTDKELEEFEQLIRSKLTLFRSEYKQYMDIVQTAGSNDTFDTDMSFDIELDNKADHLAKQEAANMAYRKAQTIRALENALIRIQNKTFGIDLKRNKLIPKERLRVVPWATDCID